MLYRGRLLTPTSPDTLAFVEDGALVVDGEGRILDVGCFQEVETRHPGSVILDLRPRWILPGLIDLHTHVPQYPAVAMDGLDLLPWLERHIYPAERAFADREQATEVARRFLSDLLQHGTTTAVIMSSTHVAATDALFREAEKAGLRAVIGKVMMDARVPEGLRESAAASLAESEALCQQWHGRRHGRLRYAFAPRFAPACSPELMRGVGRLAQKYGAHIQTHLSEHPEELGWVRDLFPEASSYTDVYRRMGLLGPQTLLAHGIHLNAAERELILASGAALVHCPRSNAFLKNGTMALRRFLTEGHRVGLGTDVAAGPSLSLWEEMGMACMASKLRWAHQRDGKLRLEGMTGLDEVQRAQVAKALELEPEAPIGPVTAFWLATLGGARALGLEERVGSLEVGKEADFIVVEPRTSDTDTQGAVTHAPEQVLSRLVYRGDPFMVRATFVRGQQCGVRVG